MVIGCYEAVEVVWEFRLSRIARFVCAFDRLNRLFGQRDSTVLVLNHAKISKASVRLQEMVEPTYGLTAAAQSDVLIAQELEQLSREQLVEHIKRQNEYIRKQSEQIRELQGRPRRENGGGPLPVTQKRNKNAREFNFSKYQKKHVALKFFYLGSIF